MGAAEVDPLHNVGAIGSVHPRIVSVIGIAQSVIGIAPSVIGSAQSVIGNAPSVTGSAPNVTGSAPRDRLRLHLGVLRRCLDGETGVMEMVEQVA